jgi:hypothetical protein
LRARGPRSEIGAASAVDFWPSGILKSIFHGLHMIFKSLFTGMITFGLISIANAQSEHVKALPSVTSMIKVGKMDVALPKGEWRVLHSGEIKTSITGGSSSGGAVERKFLVQLNDRNQLVATGFISATKYSSLVSSWSDSVCQRTDTLWVKQTDGNFNYPACLFINHAHPLWVNVPTNEFDKFIFDWFRHNKVDIPKTGLLTSYRKYFSGDFINVTYIINPELLGFAPDTATAWSNSQWHPGLIKEDVQKVKYIESLKQWAESIEVPNRASLMRGSPGVETLQLWPENK